MTSRWLAVGLLVAIGCGDDGASPPGGSPDLAPAGEADLGGPDLKSGTGCSTTPQTGDGADCKTANCPAGTIGVNQEGGGCTCFFKCDPNNQTDCSCDRLCVPLVGAGDAGVVGGACLPAKGPGQRCGTGAASPTFCAQDLICAGPASGNAYCLYTCKGVGGECPSQTTCVAIDDSAGQMIGLACTYNSAGNTDGKPTGSTCDPANECASGNICNTTCQAQCDGPGATCASGACTALAEAGRVYGYTCQP